MGKKTKKANPKMITLLFDAGYVFCLPPLGVHDRVVNFFGLKCI